jgi:lipoprotein
MFPNLTILPRGKTAPLRLSFTSSQTLSNGVSMKLKSLALAVGFSVLSSNASAAADLSKETAAYKAFVVEQIDLLLADTEKFADYLKKATWKTPRKSMPSRACTTSATSRSPRALATLTRASTPVSPTSPPK